MKKIVFLLLQYIVEVISLPLIIVFAFFSRLKTKKIDIGIGPQPLINNVYHKMALQKFGYSVETFVSNPFYITDKFDIVLSEKFKINTLLGKLCSFVYLIYLAFKYKVLYIYFNGGPLGVSTKLLWRLEPLLYRLAGVKIVVMPYGSDVQEMTRSKNLYFKHVMSMDYPGHRKRRKSIEMKIDLWSKNANHLIGGCEWVDYMYAWDTLMLAHFSIEMTDPIAEADDTEDTGQSFTVLHAPNHKMIKGTQHLEDAVKELQKEGYDIRLLMLTKVSNEEILHSIKKVDLIADQFVIGWYAMFAIEAMMLGKPVLCYLRDDLIDLYRDSGLIENNEIPIINTTISKIKEHLVWAYSNREVLKEIGAHSREYVQRHHSLDSVGSVFDRINKEIMEN